MTELKIAIPDSFYKEETRCDYVVSNDIKKVWAVELDLLFILLEACKKYDISVFASDGTMLGAARHNGFIPWDNDIDVTMKREDFEKLCKIAPYEFKAPYFFQTNETDPGSCRGHGQLRNSNTTAIIKPNWKRGFQFNQGVFIDIFPLDNVPDDATERKKYINKVRRVRAKMLKWENLTIRYNPRADRILKRVIKTPIHYISKWLHVGNPFYYYYERMKRQYNNTETEYCGDLAIVGLQKEFYQKNCDLEEDPVYLPFEMIKIPVPKNYIEILSRRYGNWKEYVVNDSVHGDTYFDVDNSYMMYISGELIADFDF